MKVIFRGPEPVLIHEESSQKRYVFPKGEIKDIPFSVLRDVWLSGHTSSQNLEPYEELVKPEEPKPTIIDKTKKHKR